MKRNTWFLLALVAILGLVLAIFGVSAFGGAGVVLSAPRCPPTLINSPGLPLTLETGDPNHPEAPLVFAVVGDSRHNTEVHTRLLDKVAVDGNMFLINTGDVVERGDRANFAAFRELMADFPLPFCLVPGNHDLGTGDSLKHFLASGGAPAPHYSFDVGTAHFTVANSASGYLRPGELHWIDQDLAATGRPVKLVFVHYPPFDPAGSDHILYSGNDEFMALIQKHDVDYVFSGHIHAYGQAMRNGTMYVISGGAGAPLRQWDQPGAFYHYVQVTVDGNQVRTEVVKVVP